jgi:hypothetical protein
MKEVRTKEVINPKLIPPTLSNQSSDARRRKLEKSAAKMAKITITPTAKTTKNPRALETAPPEPAAPTS